MTAREWKEKHTETILHHDEIDALIIDLAAVERMARNQWSKQAMAETTRAWKAEQERDVWKEAANFVTKEMERAEALLLEAQEMMLKQEERIQVWAGKRSYERTVGLDALLAHIEEVVK
jgi:hypothetical protein